MNRSSTRAAALSEPPKLGPPDGLDGEVALAAVDVARLADHRVG